MWGRIQMHSIKDWVLFDVVSGKTIEEAEKRDDYLQFFDELSAGMAPIGKLASNYMKAGEELLLHIRARIDAFVNGGEQFDDITMLCLRYRGNAPRRTASESE